jgi:hypothetical protein
MKAFWALLIAASASAATILVEPSALVAQSSAKVPAASSFDGIWEGKMNDLPAIELKIADSQAKVGGTIVFYFQERSNPSEPWHVSGGSPVTLLLPRVEGKILTFEVEHHKCHDCAELGPNVKFRVELTGPDEARLWKLENQDASKDLGPGLKLVRRTEPAAPQEPARSPQK